MSRDLLPEYGWRKMGLANHKVVSSLWVTLFSVNRFWVNLDATYPRGSWTLLCLASGVGLVVNWKSSKTMLRCLGREELFRSNKFQVPSPLRLAHHLLGLAALRTFLLQPSLPELSLEDLCGPHIAFLSMSAFGSVSKLIPVKLFKFSSFLLVVPFLYGVIFKFRQGHAETSAGICNGTSCTKLTNVLWICSEIPPCLWLGKIFSAPSIFFDPGISERERQRRKESNRISTKINFAAWLVEVQPVFSFSSSDRNSCSDDELVLVRSPITF